jgi:hypothetical protein
MDLFLVPRLELVNEESWSLGTRKRIQKRRIP